MRSIDKIHILFAFLIVTSLFFITTSFLNPIKRHNYVINPPAAISYPKSGDILHQGKTYIIKWKGGTGSTDIFLINHAYESEGVSISIADRIYNIANSGSYSYKVPTNIPTGEYKFTIGSLNSEYFDIEK